MDLDGGANPAPYSFPFPHSRIIYVVLNSATPRWLIGHLVRRTFFKFRYHRIDRSPPVAVGWLPEASRATLQNKSARL